MKTSTIRHIISCANYQIKKAQKLLEQTEAMWNNSLNLKLYTASSINVFEKDIIGGKIKVELDNETVSSLFYSFCEEQFEMFNECMFEGLKQFSDFRDIAEYIGRTSSFYLTSMYNNYKNKYATALYEIASDLLADVELKTVDGTVQVDFEKTMEYYDDDYEKLVIDLGYIINGLVEHVEGILQDVKLVYDYIANVKENQKELFTEYVFLNVLN